MNKPCNNCSHNTSFKNDVWCEHHFESECIKYVKYQEQLEKRRKYVAGDIIKTLEDLNKQNIVYFGSSPKPMAFISSMQYRIVNNLLRRGQFRYCIKKAV